jgi:hypothetical protein
MKKLLLLPALLLSIAAFCTEKPTMVLQKKSNSKKKLTFELPATVSITLSHKRMYGAIITGYTDSTLIMKVRKIQGAFSKDEIAACKVINHDKSLTLAQKDSAFSQLIYKQDMTLPLDSIKSMNYSPGVLKGGKAKERLVMGVFIVSDLTLESVLLSTAENNNQVATQDQTQAKSSYPVGTQMLGLAALGAMEYSLYCMQKNICPAKWQIAKAADKK